MKKKLRANAHSLKAIVSTGNSGLTEPVLNAIDRALTDHELIKVRIRSADREERKMQAATICGKSGAELIQLIGQIAVFYRKRPEKN